MKKYLAILFFISVSVISCFAQQQFGGIGAQLFLDTMGGHTMPCIQGLVPNSPADQYLKATDFIIKVNDISCLDKNIQDVVAMIRGEVGTTVKITVADTKEGKRPREYDLPRVGILSPGQNAAPAPDPVTVFNTECEQEIAKMKKSGTTIVKTAPSDCGSYFFNFDAEKEVYHIRVWALADKAQANTLSMTARVFDNANEGAATTITNFSVINRGNMNRGELDGTATFNKPGIGVVNVLLHDDNKKCRAMYVVIY